VIYSAKGDFRFMIRIRELREEKQITQRELADLLKVAQNTISNWEKGIREPDSKTLIKLAEIFDCSIDYLLGRDETILNNHDKREFTEEELEEIKNFKEYVISKRKNKK
jgi:transcriptional regulator with XRE-family HTH domain